MRMMLTRHNDIPRSYLTKLVISCFCVTGEGKKVLRFLTVCGERSVTELLSANNISVISIFLP